MRDPGLPRIRVAQHHVLQVLAGEGNGDGEHTAAEIARVTGYSRDIVLAQLRYLQSIRYARAYRRAWGTAWALTGAGRAWLKAHPTAITPTRGTTEGAAR